MGHSEQEIAGGRGEASRALARMLAGTAYQAVAPLGRGGMGEVVLAEHVALAKPVVVKLLHKHLAGDPRLVERMLVEARALAALSHPHLVTVTDYGTTLEGRTFLVMERLVGVTLGDELKKRGAIPLLEAIEYVVQLLDALGEVHAAGLVHRDVKLGNVFLCDAVGRGVRTIKLLDFGIVKVSAPDGPRAARFHRQFPTEEGAMIGTPRTAAPEQVRGLAVDARADLYAAALLLYTLIAGHGPFRHARDVADVLRAQTDETPAPLSSASAQAVPAELDRVLAKALAKRPGDRYPTAQALIMAITWAMPDPAVEAPREAWNEAPHATRETVRRLEPVVASARAAEPNGASDPTFWLPSTSACGDTETLSMPAPSHRQTAPAGRSHGFLARAGLTAAVCFALLVLASLFLGGGLR